MSSILIGQACVGFRAEGFEGVPLSLEKTKKPKPGDSKPTEPRKVVCTRRALFSGILVEYKALDTWNLVLGG